MPTDTIVDRYPSPWKVKETIPYKFVWGNGDIHTRTMYQLVDADDRPIAGLADSDDKQLLQFIAANVNIGSALYADVVSVDG